MAVFEAVDKEWAKHRPVPFKAFRQVLPLGRVLSLGQGDGVPQKGQQSNAAVVSGDGIERSNEKIATASPAVRKSSDE
ncbi:hypothetical protein [Mesorhizobium sp. M0633]|uniref:hypothetical protein n=1 Tax=Mesorhizobium sp. M0633 TaxID=2956977 RepID=UPI003337A28F